MTLSILQNFSVVLVLAFHHILKKECIFTHTSQTIKPWFETIQPQVMSEFESSLLSQPKIYCPVKTQNSLWLSVLWADQIIEKAICTFIAVTILSWSLTYNFVIFLYFCITAYVCFSRDMQIEYQVTNLPNLFAIKRFLVETKVLIF